MGLRDFFLAALEVRDTLSTAVQCYPPGSPERCAAVASIDPNKLAAYHEAALRVAMASSVAAILSIELQSLRSCIEAMCHAAVSSYQHDSAWHRADVLLNEALNRLEVYARTIGQEEPPDGMCEAHKLWPGRFGTHKQFKAWLDRHPEVERKRKGMRLLVNAAQMFESLAEEAKVKADEIGTDEIYAEAKALRSKRRK